MRYGGHRQAAGFTIETDKYEAFQVFITEKFREKYDTINLPKKTIEVESIVNIDQINLETLAVIDQFRPFGIGNRKPLWIIENLTISQIKMIGKEKNHLSIEFDEMPKIKSLLWNFETIFPDGIPSI